jgi:GWxTD domain-containing protein
MNIAKKVLLYIIIILINGNNLFSQEKNSYYQNLSNPKFYYDIFNYIYDGKKNKLELYITVPYTQVRFIKKGNLYEAKYRVDFSIYDEDKKNLLQEKSWYETIKVQDFNSTTNQNNIMISNKSFLLSPGNYIFICNIEDQETKKNLYYEDKYTVRILNPSLSLSDIMFVNQVSENKILPNITRNILSSKNIIPFYFEIYSDTSIFATINYSIFKFDKKTDEMILNLRENINLQKGKNQLLKKIDFKNLTLGTYRLEIDIEDTVRKLKTKSFKVFTSYWSGMPVNITDLNKAIEQMAYIASSSEISEMLNAKNEEEKKRLFSEFWKKKDPTPGTEENEIFNIYYQRVAFANSNFSTYREGWKTDFGMIYILLGPPDNIERHPFEFDTKPYEVWSYYQYNYTFYFVDESGFGEYRLIYPNYGDWTKFRP